MSEPLREALERLLREDAESKELDPFFGVSDEAAEQARSALSASPATGGALDVERLARALHAAYCRDNRPMHSHRLHSADAIAAEYDRLAHPASSPKLTETQRRGWAFAQSAADHAEGYNAGKRDALAGHFDPCAGCGHERIAHYDGGNCGEPDCPTNCVSFAALAQPQQPEGTTMTETPGLREALRQAIHDTLYHNMDPKAGFRWYWQAEDGTPNALADAVMARLAHPTSSPEDKEP